MATLVNLRIRIEPWEDERFVRAVEAARDQARAEGLTINGPKAAARAEELVRAAGFPQAKIDCERTVDEAMAHAARWTARRDGPAR